MPDGVRLSVYPETLWGIFMNEAYDLSCMQRALELAARGRGLTSPNPMVGAVIARNGRIIAEGYHRRAGGDHAEIVALRNAGSKAKGAMLYVTLEPCCHTGRTGPCTRAIVEAGITRVVFTHKDPDPRVNGKGARCLRRAGIKVSSGLLAGEASHLNEVYMHNHGLGRPFVILKTAQSIDGRIATVTGHSQWISGPDALKFSHQLRAEVDAVIVGMGTVRSDNPSLTVRHVKGRNPYRIVVTRTPRLPHGTQLLKNNGDFKTIIATARSGQAALTKSRAAGKPIVWEVSTGMNGLLDLRDLLAKAWQFGIRSVLVEGGGQLATSFLKAELVDKYVAIMAPLIIGDGISAVGDLHVRKLTGALQFWRHEFFACGRDCIFVGYPAGEVGYVYRTR